MKDAQTSFKRTPSNRLKEFYLGLPLGLLRTHRLLRARLKVLHFPHHLLVRPVRLPREAKGKQKGSKWEAAPCRALVGGAKSGAKTLARAKTCSPAPKLPPQRKAAGCGQIRNQLFLACPRRLRQEMPNCAFTWAHPNHKDKNRFFQYFIISSLLLHNIVI